MYRRSSPSTALPLLLVLVAACALFALPAAPAAACSINAAGSCGGTACPEGETCTKVSDFECDCVKDSVLAFIADDDACVEAAAAVASLARRAAKRERPARAGARNCLGDCLAECRDDHLFCIDFCREFEPGDPRCIEGCNLDRDTCDRSCFDDCSDRGAPTADPLSLGGHELDLPAASGRGEERSGGVIAVRIFFQVQGLGSFSAGVFDTARGHTNAWVKPGLSLRLSARPGPGHRFSHWLFNGQFAGSDAEHRVSASRGLTITAVFARADD